MNRVGGNGPQAELQCVHGKGDPAALASRAKLSRRLLSFSYPNSVVGPPCKSGVQLQSSVLPHHLRCMHMHTFIMQVDVADNIDLLRVIQV